MTNTLVAALLASSVSTAALAQAVDADTRVGTESKAGTDVHAGSDTADVGAAGSTGVGANVGTSTGASDYADTPDAAAEGNPTMESGSEYAMGADASVDDGAMDYSEFLTSVYSEAEVAADIENIESDAEVQTVLLSELEQHAAPGASIDDDLSAQEERITDLREEIEGNETLVAAIEDEGHAVEDVVAINIGTEGEVRVFIDDRA